MGYVHDTHMSQYIPPTAMHYVTGTWTDAAGEGHAFATIPQAINAAAALDTNIHDVVIQLADGVYQDDEGGILCKNLLGIGTITIQGNAETPSNVVIDGGFFKRRSGTIYIFKDLKFELDASETWFALNPSYGAVFEYGNINFGAGYYVHVTAQYGGFLNVVDNCVISADVGGGELGHIYLTQNGAYFCMSTITIEEGLTIDCFLYAEANSFFYGGDYDGDFTGTSYGIDTGSVDYIVDAIPGSEEGFALEGTYVNNVYQGLSALDIYPVGAVYISVDSTSPETLFGGTWVAFGAGKVLIGIDSGDASFDTAEETGGAKTVQSSAQTFEGATTDTGQASAGTTARGSTASTLTLRAHTHSYTPEGTNTPGPATSVVQPYIVVYMWKRTA